MLDGRGTINPNKNLKGETKMSKANQIMEQEFEGEKVRIINNLDEWTKFMEKGIICQLHVHRWRATTKLTLSDIGVQTDDVEESAGFNDYIEAGHKLLLPASIIKQANAIEVAARQSLKRYGFKTHWGMFMPAPAFKEWRSQFDQYQNKWNELAESIVTNWSTIYSKTLEAYAVIARKAYRRIYPMNEQQYQEDIFVDNYVAKIASSFPVTGDQMLATWGMDYELSFIPLPSMIAMDKVEATRIMKANEDEKYIRGEVRRKAVEERQALVSGFFGDLQSQIRNTALDAVSDVLASITRNGNLHPRSVTQLRNLTEQLKNLNFWNDETINAVVTNVEGILATEKRDIEKTLTDIGIVVQSELLTINAQSQRLPRAGIIPDIPGADMTKASRLALGLEKRSPVIDELKSIQPVIKHNLRGGGRAL
jgi:hypothetical protein